jgi:hypothetical protein
MLISCGASDADPATDGADNHPIPYPPFQDTLSPPLDGSTALMAHDRSVGKSPALVEVQVRSANPDVVDPNQDFSGSCLRIRQVAINQPLLSGIINGLHKKLQLRVAGFEFFNFKIDEIVKILRVGFSVIPAKAGIQLFQTFKNYLDSGFHRSDDFLREYQF